MKRVARMIAALIAAGLLLASVGVSAQQMYRWVDKDGKVHYSDSAPVDPGKGVENRKLGASVIDTSGLDYGTQQAVKNHPVTLYTAPNCKDACEQARALLSKRGVPFSEISVTDEKTRAALSKASGDTQVPVLLVGRDITKGWEAGAYTGALDSAGYPKSIAPGRQQQAAAKPPADTAKGEAQNPNELQRPKGKYLP